MMVNHGFPPAVFKDSKLLILGSFPSVKSREVNFYYGNPRNSFWEIVSSFFGEPTPTDYRLKNEFLSRRRIALWDVVEECEIVGSADSTIKNFRVADIPRLLQNYPIEYIILNGGKAYEIFTGNIKGVTVPYEKLPSTSPANAHPKKEIWHDALRRIFG